LLRGRSPEHLSNYYRLDCDYGTAVMAIYKQGECNDPLYLCAGHFTEAGHTAPHRREVRPSAPDPRPTAVRAHAVVAHARPMVVEPAVIEQTMVEPCRVAQPVAGQPPVNQPIAGPAVVADRTPALDIVLPAPVAPENPPVAVNASKPSVARVVRPATNAPFVKPPARDVTYGDSAKALVDEAIWNMSAGDYDAYAAALKAGKSPMEAAQAAGGQLAFVHRKIGEYTFKIEMVLSEAPAKISAADVIEKPFEQATLEIIEGELPDSEKDEAIARLGGLQQAINGGVGREMTPLQAHRIARAIGDRASWGIAQLPEELKPVYRAVYTSVREAIRAAAPLAFTLDERLANLYAAKAELEAAPAASGLHRLTA
jgi:hypothetical protein